MDIRKRLAMGRSTMQSLSSVWKSKDISTTTKARLLNVLVWSVAIYGSEGWTLRNKEEKYIEAFEMCCYRRLLRIPWTQHKTNEWILCQLKVDKRTSGSCEIIKVRILRSYDTEIRKSGEGNRSRVYQVTETQPFLWRKALNDDDCL